ncbi:MAG: RNA methyltransferase [Lachnospiraceae bacterium]|nr:RNA methyltransferase [Lachnospiraceae bacterium]
MESLCAEHPGGLSRAELSGGLQKADRVFDRTENERIAGFYSVHPENGASDTETAAGSDDYRETAANVLREFSRPEFSIPVHTAPLPVLKELTGYSLTRGMLCAMRRKPLPDPKEILSGKRRVAVLEGVTNPTNVGAIFRSAAALSMEAVLLDSASADPLYRRSVRVSMGSVFQIPWTVFRGKDPVGALHEAGFRTAAMALSDRSVSIDDPVLSKERTLAVILGSEGSGLSEKTILESDYVVRIPMANGVDSLNVAAASAVAFHVLSRSISAS